MFLLSLDQSDLTISLASLNVNSSELEFSDDISAVRSQISALMASPKSVEEALKKICYALLQHQFDSIDALECCLNISIKLSCKLLAQKIASKLNALGRSISIEVIEFINSGRDSDIWTNVPSFISEI